ncbi:MAG TPA: YggT family protein [Candidatus Lumbricidophila sp.]|nr:YggT family protein [Candidatus Lumbricidophila sp.]
MGALAILWGAVSTLLFIYLIVMWVRFVLDMVQSVNRSWRPRGAMLLLAELVYTVTDPLIKLMRRFVKPIRIGQVTIDLSWTLGLLVVIVALNVVRWLA